MDSIDDRIIQGDIGKHLDENYTPFIQNMMNTHDLPSLAIGVVNDNEVVYAKGFGVKSIQSGDPLTPTTIFHLASVSKPFSATAIMQLVEQGKMNLEAPIITYLPYFKLDDERYRDITIQQMLSHISGMPDEEDYEWDKPQYDAGALERYVRSLSHYKLLSEPGMKFAYSNMAFECLGDVIAKVSGMSFDDYVKEHILNPVGMHESTFLKPEYLPESWASPHIRLLTKQVCEEYPYNRMHAPSSTLHSNVLEMCNWAITNINHGHFRGRQILNATSYDILWTPRANRSTNEQVGLSWFITEYRREKMINHGGGDNGFRSYFTMLPDKRIAVVVLCNLIPAFAEEFAYAAIDVLLGYQPGAISPFASVQIGKTLREQGLQAAATEWASLKIDHPDEYDFSLDNFYNLFLAMVLNKTQEAEQIAQLCARILPETELNRLEKYYSSFQNNVAAVILSALREPRNRN
jgi:CubicO group peptidase (beta-lactamase class C family)